MPFSVPTSTKKTSTDGFSVITDAIDTTGSDLIAVFMEWYGGGTENVMSDVGTFTNSWIPLASVTTGQSPARLGRLFYKLSPSTNGSHQFQAEFSNSTFPSIYVLSFPSDGTPTFNAVIGSGSGGVAGASIQPGSITFNELFIVGAVFGQTVSGISIDGTFSTFDGFPSEGSGLAGGISYKIRTTSGVENPTVSWTGSVAAAISMATFTSGGAGASSGEGTGWPKIFKSPRKSGLP